MKKIAVLVLLACCFSYSSINAEENYIEYPNGGKQEVRDFLVEGETGISTRSELEFDCTRNYDKGVVVGKKIPASKMHPVASKKWRKTSAYYFTYEDESKVGVSVKISTGAVSVKIGFAKYVTSGGSWEKKANSKKFSKPKMHTKGTVKKYTHKYSCPKKYTYAVTHESASIVYEK